ncbi:MAG: hypothetical protein HKO08_08115 [Erythrobacter sp.]|nr:hypothetical protein [Erythrobacter sp.]
MTELPDLGLWGDGDEIWAIEAAFETIEMEVPVEDASQWLTVGNVWQSAVLRRAELAHDDSAWDDFRRAISSETMVDWRLVGKQTQLIDGKGHSILSRLLKGLWRKIKADA